MKEELEAAQQEIKFLTEQLNDTRAELIEYINKYNLLLQIEIQPK